MRIQNLQLGRRLLVPSLLFVLVLSACAPNSADTTPTLSVDAIFTAAAQTIQAQQATQLAMTPPTNTPSPSPFPTLPPPSPMPTISFASATPQVGGTGQCDAAAFVSDVSIPDGTVIKAGEKFTKTWRLYNSGSCNWTTSYKLAFASGEAMSGASTVLAAQVNSGSQTDISVAMVAPTYNGTFKGNWRMQNASGQPFGNVIYVEIKVTNGSGTAPATSSATEVTISGNAGIGSVTITYAGTGGGASGTVNDDGVGNYTFKVAKGWSGTVVPSKGTYVFTPASKSYSNLQADQTSQDFTVDEGQTPTASATP